MKHQRLRSGGVGKEKVRVGLQIPLAGDHDEDGDKRYNIGVRVDEIFAGIAATS